MMPILRSAQDAPFMIVGKEEWLPPPVVLFPQPCPYVTARGCAFCLRPPNRTDWVKALREVVPQHPRCILFDLPERAINLTVADLRVWIDEAQGMVPEVPMVLAQKGCKLPCGEQAACLRCPQAATRLLREQTADWAEREVPIAAQLKQKFPQFAEQKRTAIALWALEPSTANPNLPIPIAEIAKLIHVSRESVRRWLLEAKACEPALMRRLNVFREQRLRRTAGYEVRE